MTPPTHFHVDPPSEPPLSEEDRGAMFASLAAATVQRPPTMLDRASALPWATRTALACGVLLPTAIAYGVWTRPDGIPVTSAQALWVLAALSVVGCAAALRPAGRPLHRPWKALTLVPLAAPLGAAWWDGVHHAGMSVANPALAHLTCGLLSVIAALLGAATVVLLDRDAPGRAWRATAAGGAGACLAYLATTLHCPWSDPTHLLVSHAVAGLGVAAVIIGFRARPLPPGEA